jgi:ABC-type cobalamin transport system permease subunit
VVALIFSRWLTRFARVRRLISYALLIEGVTLAVIVAALFLSSKGRHG